MKKLWSNQLRTHGGLINLFMAIIFTITELKAAVRECVRVKVRYIKKTSWHWAYFSHINNCRLTYSCALQNAQLQGITEDTMTAINAVLTSAAFTNNVLCRRCACSSTMGRIHNREPHRTVTTVQLPLYGLWCESLTDSREPCGRGQCLSLRHFIVMSELCVPMRLALVSLLTQFFACIFPGQGPLMCL